VHKATEIRAEFIVILRFHPFSFNDNPTEQAIGCWPLNADAP
jgi:hypothetical protein